MSVIDMRIRNDMYQFSHLHAAYLRQHMHKHRILHYVPVVSGKHVLGALVQYRVKRQPAFPGFLRYVKGHAVRAGIQIHLA